MYSGLSKESNKIKKNYIYFCFEGNKYNGYDFIDEALKNGASKIIGERKIDINNYEQVKDVNLSMIEYAQEIFDNPQEKIKIIGITGTDGKTSTALIINHLLNKLSTASYLGTNGFYINNQKQEYTGFTTPFSDIFYDNLKKAVNKKSNYFVMEVSSHALEQNRLGNIYFDSAIFTNLTSEHLDFHKTMENYYKAKKKLFKQIRNNGHAIINIDNKYGQMLADEKLSNKIITIGKNEEADYQILNIQECLSETKFEMIDKKNKKKYELISPLLCEFNVYNLVEAIVVVNKFGFEIEEIMKYLKEINIPGRMEYIRLNTDKKIPDIVIDFAHTADAIHRVMHFLNKMHVEKGKGRLIVVTGSAGERDSQKRPEMGRAASDKADILFLTEDDPRSEKVENIANDLRKGISNSKCVVYFNENRKKAIEEVIKLATSDDTIIFFGKGEMEVMYYDGFTLPYSEKREIIQNLNIFKEYINE